MIRRMTMLVVAAVLLLGPGDAASQVRGQRRGQGLQRQRMELERRLQGRISQLVRTQMGLDQDGMAALQEVMQSFREERSLLSRAQASVRHRLRDPALPDIGDSEAMDLLAEMSRLQEEELELFRREQEALLGVLTPSQLVVFYRIRDQRGQQVQQLRGRGPPGGPVGGAGGILGTRGIF